MKMMDRLNLKKEKNTDLQSAMQGDLNSDGIVDFEEWRHNMKKYFLSTSYTKSSIHFKIYAPKSISNLSFR